MTHPQDVEPAAWVLVPREPTPEMRAAAYPAIESMETKRALTVWRAMIAASPSPSGDVREAVARILHKLMAGDDPDELIHHPAQKSWEEPSWRRWEQWEEQADELIAFFAALYVERIGVGVSQSQPCTDGSLPILKEPQHDDGEG